MASIGKCEKCAKTVYAMEGIKVGPPKKEIVFHKLCFKCAAEGCTWQLDARSYYYYDGKAYCKNHNKATGFSNADHAKGTLSTNDVQVKTALSAPKADLVNEQLRAGGSNHAGIDSQLIQHNLAAPKLDVAGSGQIRAGGANSAGLNSQEVNHALHAPKLAVASGGQVRGSGTSSAGVDSQQVAHALNAPKLDVGTGGQIRGAK